MGQVQRIGDNVVKVVPGDKPGWKPCDLIKDVGDFISEHINNGSYGPYVLVLSDTWKNYLDVVYDEVVWGDQTLRLRLIDWGDDGTIAALLLTPTLNPWQICLFEFSGSSE